MKNYLLQFIKLSITFLLFYILFRNLGFSNILESILSASKFYLALGIITFFISVVLGAWQWNILLECQSINLKFPKAFSVYMVGLFFNNFLPGSMGGDIVKIYRLKKDYNSGKPALAATFIDRFVGLFTLCFFSLISSFYIYFFSDVAVNENIFLFICILFVIFIFSVMVFFSRRITKFIYQTLLKNINPFGIKDRIEEIHRYFHLYRNNRKAIIKIIILSFITQLFRVGVHFFTALALGFDVAFIYFLIFVPLIALSAVLPISFGGFGVREGLSKILYGYIHPNGVLAVATPFLASLIVLFVSLIGGIIFVFQKSSRKAKAV